jgi:hypothetical protein
MLLVRLAMAPRKQDLVLDSGRHVPPRVVVAPSVGGRVEDLREEPRGEPNAVSPVLPSAGDADPWGELVSKIKKLNTPMGSQLEHTVMLSSEGEVLRIGVPPKYKFVFDQAQSEPFRKKMENFVKTYWMKNYGVRFELLQADGVASPKANEEKKKKQDLDELRRQVENHPLVQMTKSVFKTEIHSINREDK